LVGGWIGGADARVRGKRSKGELSWRLANDGTSQREGRQLQSAHSSASQTSGIAEIAPAGTRWSLHELFGRASPPASRNRMCTWFESKGTASKVHCALQGVSGRSALCRAPSSLQAQKWELGIVDQRRTLLRGEGETRQPVIFQSEDDHSGSGWADLMIRDLQYPREDRATEK
jgi:hypothetical protein